MKKADYILIWFALFISIFTWYLFYLKTNINKQNSYNRNSPTIIAPYNYSWLDDSINEGNSWALNTVNEVGNSDIMTNKSIPSDLDAYFDYIIENWVEWVDYIMYTLNEVPNIVYNDKSMNNDSIMYPYFKKNMFEFKLENNGKDWYVAFVTHKKISELRDFFLGIDWESKWPIRKDKSLSNRENVYMYNLSKVVMAWWNWEWINLYEKKKTWWILNMNAYVWEDWNYVEKIIIFFK